MPLSDPPATRKRGILRRGGARGAGWVGLPPPPSASFGCATWAGAGADSSEATGMEQGGRHGSLLVAPRHYRAQQPKAGCRRARDRRRSRLGSAVGLHNPTGGRGRGHFALVRRRKGLSKAANRSPPNRVDTSTVPGTGPGSCSACARWPKLDHTRPGRRWGRKPTPRRRCMPPGQETSPGLRSSCSFPSQNKPEFFLINMLSCIGFGRMPKAVEKSGYPFVSKPLPYEMPFIGMGGFSSSAFVREKTKGEPKESE